MPDRGDELAAALRADPNSDLEQVLLREEERSFSKPRAPAPGGFTVVTKIGKAPQTALNALSLVYGEGRRMLIERVRAATDLKRGRSKHKELRTKQRDRRLCSICSQGLEKIRDEEGQSTRPADSYLQHDFCQPEAFRTDIAGLLPPPAPKKPRRLRFTSVP